MTPERMQECLTTIRWSPVTLGAGLELDNSLIRAWMDGRVAIPVSVASWLEALCFTHEASDLLRPAVNPGTQGSDAAPPEKPEHVPVYSYNLLRTLERGPVLLRSLFGTDDEGAVFFLVSRGLAAREGAELVITDTGRQIGKLTS